MKRKIVLLVAAVVVLSGLAVGGIALAAPWGTPKWETNASTSETKPVVPPSRVKIASIGVDSTLEDLHLDPNGAITPPKDYQKAGWYADGTVPGDPGPAVIAGHVDTKQGPAVFYKVRDLQNGATIEVLRGDKWVTFKVVAVKKYPKAEFPTDEVYAPTPNAQLRLITCGGEFNSATGHYVDNWVAYAAIVE